MIEFAFLLLFLIGELIAVFVLGVRNQSDNLFNPFETRVAMAAPCAVVPMRPEVPSRHPNSRSASSRRILATAWIIDVVNTPVERGVVGLYDEGLLDGHSRNGGEGGGGVTSHCRCMSPQV